MYRYTRAAFVVLLLALSIAACKKQPPVVTPQDNRPPVGPPSQPPQTPDRPVAPPSNTSREDSIINARLIETTKATFATAIYFDYDAAELSTAARDLLTTKAQIMRENSTLRIRIEGNCDERGSNEYNIALGQRRAAAAREFLIARGIAAARIETISLGEEKPAMQGATEASWSRNRRDEFVTIAGSITVPLRD